jgi:hypothetical protein
MQEVEGRHGDAENFLYLGTFRGEKEVELLFQKLVKGTLVAERGSHEPALALAPEALVHLGLPGGGLALPALRRFGGLPPGQVVGGGCRHGLIESTVLTIKVLIADFEVDHTGFHPDAGLIAFVGSRCHSRTLFFLAIVISGTELR